MHMHPHPPIANAMGPSLSRFTGEGFLQWVVLREM
jgi:hypothetical protein